MKKVILTAISILVMVVIVSINTASAEKRPIVIEMDESGQTVSLDAERRRLSEIHKKSSVDDRQTIVYELAESGMLIEFPERVSEDHAVRIAKINDP